MTKSDMTLAGILTYSGTLPLLACVALVFVPIVGIDGNAIARTYAAIILSFLCGIHWAVYLFFPEKCRRNLLITSNAVALLSWCSLLLTNQTAALVLQATCFLGVFALDVELHRAGIVPGWFYHLRRNATFIVVLCLITLAVVS